MRLAEIVEVPFTALIAISSIARLSLTEPATVTESFVCSGTVPEIVIEGALKSKIKPE